jgi:hypothetical protein
MCERGKAVFPPVTDNYHPDVNRFCKILIHDFNILRAVPAYPNQSRYCFPGKPARSIFPAALFLQHREHIESSRQVSRKIIVAIDLERSKKTFAKAGQKS